MEKNQTQPKENLQVAPIETSAMIPADIYVQASTLELTADEQKNLMAPFDDDEYEIRPDGFIYIPQALIKKRLNDVVGIGQWAIIKIKDHAREVKQDLFKVFFDGALMIRGKFASRSVGEASYSIKNSNQSEASALEAAKSDTIVRCCKDLGIASEVHQPAFCRKWQKKYAVKVYVKKKSLDGRDITEVAWRRKDVDPFFNETGPVLTAPVVQEDKKVNGNTSTELPWLNHGPEYDAAIKELLEGKTLNYLRTKYRISKTTGEAIVFLLQKEWAIRLETCKTLPTLSQSYTDNKAEVDEYPWLKDMFSKRRDVIKNGKQVVA